MPKLIKKAVEIGEVSFTHVNQVSGDVKLIVDGKPLSFTASEFAGYEIKEESKPSEEEKGEEI